MATTTSISTSVSAMTAPLSELPFELSLLANAHQYQKWVADSVAPYLGHRILEVGAGIGNMSQHLPLNELLVLSEVEPSLISILEKRIRDQHLDRDNVRIHPMDLNKDFVQEFQSFDLDTIVSFNVLEHIKDDAKVLSSFVKLLEKSKATGPKRIVTFVPAHQWAYGSLDKMFDHYRRYSAGQFRALAKSIDFKGSIETRYFNLIGLGGWFVTGRILKKQKIDPSTVATFEKICPWIRGFDDFIHKTLRVPFGQTLLAVITL